MQEYKDYWFNSSNGLRLYARDYPHTAPEATILCIPGLTRNSADFSQLCDQLATRYRVIAVDLRGRGKSDYDPDPYNYHPGVYVDDITCLLNSLELESVILIGTSLGGLISMILSAMQAERITAAIINDIGPEANQAGLDRIKAYVCNPTPVNSWAEAVSKTHAIQGREYPNFSESDWVAFTNNLYREDNEGNPVLNYDSAIAILLEQNQDNAVPPNLWSLFDTIQSTPLLLLRGELSDILTRDCVEKMQQKKPDMQFVEVASCGHAPLLTEPESMQAITQFLTTVSSHDADAV